MLIEYEQRPILPMSVLNVLDWVLVAAWHCGSIHWFAHRQNRVTPGRLVDTGASPAPLRARGRASVTSPG